MIKEYLEHRKHMLEMKLADNAALRTHALELAVLPCVNGESHHYQFVSEVRLHASYRDSIEGMFCSKCGRWKQL